MTRLAIIGGTGLDQIPDLEITRHEAVKTPFGEPSAALTFGRIAGIELVFLPRHGATHSIPPHRVNYRANLWALHHAGVDKVVAVAAVGGISQEMAPCRIVVPNQIIDYTYGREHTYFDKDLTQVTHIDFTEPYCELLRQQLIGAAHNLGMDPVTAGAYGAVQGPRLETAMEIVRMAKEGCNIVGMTGMPEASLARELELCYACCAVVANWAAGIGSKTITMSEIERNLKIGMEQVRHLLAKFLSMQPQQS